MLTHNGLINSIHESTTRQRKTLEEVDIVEHGDCILADDQIKQKTEAARGMLFPKRESHSANEVLDCLMKGVYVGSPLHRLHISYCTVRGVLHPKHMVFCTIRVCWHPPLYI